MLIKVLSNNREYAFSDAEMTVQIRDVEIDGSIVTTAIITLALPRFLTDISLIQSAIGNFQNTKCIEISFGTRDIRAAYILQTYDFTIAPSNIDNTLKENQLTLENIE